MRPHTQEIRRTSKQVACLLSYGAKELLAGLKGLAKTFLDGRKRLRRLFLQLLRAGSRRREALLLAHARSGLGKAAGAKGLRQAGRKRAHHDEEGARTTGEG